MIETLPKGMEALFADMWDRAGSDTFSFSHYAAQVISLTLAWDVRQGSRGKVLTMAMLLAAQNYSFQNTLSFEQKVRGLLRDKKVIEQERRNIRIRCFGSVVQRTFGGLDADTEEIISPREFAVRTHINFIHKSAREFFLNTSTGEYVRQTYPCDTIHRYPRLAIGCTVEASELGTCIRTEEC